MQRRLKLSGQLCPEPHCSTAILLAHVISVWHDNAFADDQTPLQRITDFRDQNPAARFLLLMSQQLKYLLKSYTSSTYSGAAAKFILLYCSLARLMQQHRSVCGGCFWASYLSVCESSSEWRLWCPAVFQAHSEKIILRTNSLLTETWSENCPNTHACRHARTHQLCASSSVPHFANNSLLTAQQTYFPS